jgi:hypothetical protein
MNTILEIGLSLKTIGNTDFSILILYLFDLDFSDFFRASNMSPSATTNIISFIADISRSLSSGTRNALIVSYLESDILLDEFLELFLEFRKEFFASPLEIPVIFHIRSFRKVISLGRDPGKSEIFQSHIDEMTSAVVSCIEKPPSCIDLERESFSQLKYTIFEPSEVVNSPFLIDSHFFYEKSSITRLERALITRLTSTLWIEDGRVEDDVCTILRFVDLLYTSLPIKEVGIPEVLQFCHVINIFSL